MGTFLTNVGKALTASKVKGEITYKEPKYVAIGTGSGRTVSSTTLATEVETRTAGTSSLIQTSVAGDTYQSFGTITCTTSAKSITEAALFDDASTGNMYMYTDFSVINLNVGDQLQLTLGVQYA